MIEHNAWHLTPTLFGMTANMALKLDCPDECELTTSKEIAKMLGIDDHVIKNKTTITPEKCKFTENSPEILWLFGDFVHPTMMGPYALPMLRMIPIPPKADNKHLEHTIFTHPYYVPVKSTRLSHLKVHFCEYLDREPITMEGEVIIVLHFQQMHTD
jgi:hypothetical protein